MEKFLPPQYEKPHFDMKAFEDLVGSERQVSGFSTELTDSALNSALDELYADSNS